MSLSKPSLSVFTLTMINVSTILSIKNWPLTAEYGLSSLFFLVLAALMFFIPVSLVSAELASKMPQEGGIFVWIKEAFGKKMGFLGVWLLWISNVIWYPTILSYVGATIAFSFNPNLASDPLFMFIVVLTVFWSMMLLNLRGMKSSGWMSSLALIFGTLVPGALILLFGAIWLWKGNPTQIQFNAADLLPKISGVNELVFLSGVLLGFAGMEMTAVHANDVENPKKNYPRAILYSTMLIFALSLLGTLSISIIIPKGEIQVVSASINSINVYLQAYGLGKLLPVLSLLVALGALGGVCTWIGGPSKGLNAAAKQLNLPSFFTKTNKEGMPVNIMILQGSIVTVMTMLFLYMPSVNSSFWILTALATQLYLIMYFLLFASAIVLKRREKELASAGSYSIPGGRIGMYIVAGSGLISSLFCFGIGFVPPAQISMGSLLFFEAFLLAGVGLSCIIPFALNRSRKESVSLPTPSID